MSLYKIRSKGNLLLVACLFCLIGSNAFASDGNISIEPSYVIFKNLEVGTQSDPFTITLKNTGTATMSTGTVQLRGQNSSEFSLTSNCDNETLAAGADCNITAKLTQNSAGIKNAWIDIPYGTAPKHLSVFLTTKEDIPHEVKRRLPPALSTETIADWMEANITYSPTWSITGYESGYKVKMVMFDCTNTGEGEYCGDDYDEDDVFYESSFLDPVNSETGDVSYRGEQSYKYTYTATFTIPLTNTNGDPWIEGSDVVIRFYVISDYDTEADANSISLIIPGAKYRESYDESGRKMEVRICPVGGCGPS